MKPRPRRKISNAPVYIGMMIFALLLITLWYLSGGEWGTAVKPSDLCGYAIQESLTLTGDVSCTADSLGLLPRGTETPFTMVIQSDGVVLDCNGHTITSQGGVGVVVEETGDVTIRNCTLKDQDIAVSATDTLGLTIDGVNGETRVGGIEVINGQKTVITGSTLTASGTESMWGIQIVGGTDTRITGCTIAGHLYGGINFYGTKNFTAENNHISNVRDTGIGFFEQDGYPSTEQGHITGNVIENIQQVGAFEVMHSTRDLTISKNRITNSKSVLFIYEQGAHGRVTGIRFTENQVDGCYWPFSLTECENVSIQRNEINRTSGGGLATVRDAKDIRIVENRFFLNNGAVGVAENVESFTFSRNHFDKHFEPFLRIDHRPASMNLAENDWGGCPNADQFDGITFPGDLNPVLLMQGETDTLYTLVDSDGNGKDDQDCRLD